MKVILNGKEWIFGEGKDSVEYETIAKEAGINPLYNPSVTYRSDKREGILSPRQVLLVDDGMVINCMLECEV